jgi:hypothetical protein
MTINKTSNPITSSPNPLLPSNVERSDSSLVRNDWPSGRLEGLENLGQQAPDDGSVSRRFANAALSAASGVASGVTSVVNWLNTATARHGPVPAPGAGDIELGAVRGASGGASAAVSTAGATIVERPAAAVMERLQAAIEAAQNRPVDTEAAASLVNDLRRMGPGAGADRAATNADLMKGVTDEKVKAWYAAQGLTDANVDALRKAAFRSGMPNPTGSFLNNAIQYIASPFVGAHAGPWAGAGVGFAAAAVGAPMNAFQQSAVVTLCESIREHGGPVIVPDKKNINDKHYLPELSKTLQTAVNEFSGAHDALQGTMRELGFAADTHLPSKLQSLEPAQLQTLREQAEHLVQKETKLFDTQRDFMMTQGAHERQWKGNTYQAVPRTLRAPVASYVGLKSKLDLGKSVSPTGQSVVSLVLTAAQHVAAGFDERNKQEYNNKLNLMYGDFFTAQGNEKLKSGVPLEASDIDVKKLRNFVNFPEQSLVKHVSAETKRQIDGLEKVLNDTTAPARPAADVDKDRSALQALKDDAAKLKSGKLTELTPGGLAESLLVASDKSVVSPQLLADVKAKYTMREFSAQTAQRLGQMLHLGVLGSAASSIIGKVSSAAVGGTKEAPLQQALTVPIASGIMAGFGASFQHTAISVKNNRREAETDPGLLTQVGRGMWGAAGEITSNRRGTQASREGNDLLAQEAIGQTLKFAKDVRAELGPLQTQVQVPLSTPPRPGDASASGIKEIAISIPDPTPEARAPESSAGPSRKGKEPALDQ